MLPAFVAERRHLQHNDCSCRSISPAHRSLSSKQAGRRCCCRLTGQKHVCPTVTLSLLCTRIASIIVFGEKLLQFTQLQLPSTNVPLWLTKVQSQIKNIHSQQLKFYIPLLVSLDKWKKYKEPITKTIVWCIKWVSNSFHFSRMWSSYSQ